VELSLTTFILEIINFLILVWILKRFLYKPVLDVIARRRAGIEKTMADAKALHLEAEQLQQQYQNQLAEVEQQRQQAHESLTHELETQRRQKLAQLQAELLQQQEKTRVALARQQAEQLRDLETKALKLGARFASRLLQNGAGPDTQVRLIELLNNELSQLPAERVNSIREFLTKQPQAITIVSAYPLSNPQRQALEQALSTLNLVTTSVNYQTDVNLGAGVRISVGAWALALNLRDELQGFAEFTQHE